MNQRDVNATPRSGQTKVAFIQACWHKSIVDQCRTAFFAEIDRLAKERPAASMIEIDPFEVPGSFEIPLQAKFLAQSNRYRAIVAAGFVVDGGIYRHEFVAEAVIGGLMRVQLDTGVPVISAVLTPQRFHEHQEHSDFFHKHFIVKGVEAAAACVRTLENVAQAQALA